MAIARLSTGEVYAKYSDINELVAPVFKLRSLNLIYVNAVYPLTPSMSFGTR